MSPVTVTVVLLLLGPSPASAPASGEPAPAPGEPALGESAAPPATASDDYTEQAPLDVETLLTDSSKAYLHARARLEEHPELASEAILDRLATVPPPTSTDRKRLLDVLAVLGLPDHVELFAAELRRGITRADSFADKSKALRQWLPLLKDQGAAARPALTRLVADQDLPLTARAAVLDALVEVTPPDAVGELVTLVGRGSRSLRQQLYRSLKRRAKYDPAVQRALVDATDAALREAEPSRVPALLQLRGAIAPSDDVAFIRQAGALASDPTAPFAVRVAALRALAGRDSGPAHAILVDVATRSLPPDVRGQQSAEILAWLALRGLPPAEAAALVQRFQLVGDPAPRLAQLGFAHAALSPDQSWLPPALDNPWPQVRQAAMARVTGPCASTTEKLLERRGHLAGRDAEDDRAVARSAIQALGRCRTSPRLQRLLADEDLDIELRAEAARQLARLGDDASIRAIGGALLGSPQRTFARRLASAFRHMPAPTAAGDAILCEVATRADETGHAARESLRALHGGDVTSACE